MIEYRNELHSAHAENDTLKRERDELRRKLAEKEKKKVKCPECKGALHRAGGALFWSLLGLALAGFMIFGIVHMARNHGPTHCFIDGSGLVFSLKRNVEWGTDITIGTYRSMTDSAKINCEVK